MNQISFHLRCGVERAEDGRGANFMTVIDQRREMVFSAPSMMNEASDLATMPRSSSVLASRSRSMRSLALR